MPEQPFQLTNDPPKPRPQPPVEATRQRVLFSGMDCIAGQKDLFETNGESDEREAGAE